jgi:DNA-binding beta-propeller fold protein YncE
MTVQLSRRTPIRSFASGFAFGLTLCLLSGCVSNRDAGHSETAPLARATHIAAGQSPVIAGELVEIIVVPPREDWQLGRISWIAAGPDGLIYVLHRGDKADPLVVLDAGGNVVRSWGKGLYTLPHSVRIDNEGNVWTTDATTSTVIKFSPRGAKLLEIVVAGQPSDCMQNPKRRGFCGITDVAWGSEGQVFVADGYANARIVEYTPDGQKVREWGKAGSNSGEFDLPHAIATDSEGLVYVADRQNARVQRFDLRGRWLGDWVTDGDPYTLAIDKGILWIDVLQPLEPGASRRRGRLIKVQLASGEVLGHVDPPGGHGTAITADGEALLIPAGSRLYRLNLRQK